MDTILQLVEKIFINPQVHLLEQFYKQISECYASNKTEEYCFCDCLLPKIYQLFEKNILRKDLFYLSVLINGNTNLLQLCDKYEKQVINKGTKALEIKTLFDNTLLYGKEHWLITVLNCFQDIDKLFSNNGNKFRLLKLIQMTNCIEINENDFISLLTSVNADDLKDFWKYYVQEINHLVEIYKFCDNSTCKINDILHFGSQNSFLETLSKFTDIKKFDLNSVIQKIDLLGNIHDAESQKQHFVAFYIVSNILNIIIQRCNININSMVDLIKTELLKLENTKFQISLLENLFSLIFLKNLHFLSDDEKKQRDEFYCKEKDARLILYLIKTVLDEIKLRNLYLSNTNEYNRLINLHKYVMDATWRLDLIVNVKKVEKYENKLLYYMMAPPDSLIHMCLKQGDFERSYQVIKIFNMKKSTIAKQIEFSENLILFRQKLRKSFKMKELSKEMPNMSINNNPDSIDKLVDEYFENNKIHVDIQNENIIKENISENSYLQHFQSEKETFLNLVDLILTQPKNYEDCKTLTDVVLKHNNLEDNIISDYSIFFQKIINLFNDIAPKNNYSISNLLLSSDINLSLNKFKQEEEFYDNLSICYEEFLESLKLTEPGGFNNNHQSHKCFMKIMKLCNDYVDGTKYVQKLFNYLKAFSKVLFIEQNSSDIIARGKNSSYFELLHFNRSELMGKLLFEKHLDPTEFERYFAKLKLDFLYHIIGNCFPTINLHTEENVTKEELYPENSLYVPNSGIISYIQKRNWLLAFILNSMYKIDDVKIDTSEVRLRTFINYKKLPKIQNLQVIYDNNVVVTALQNDISYQKIADYIKKQMVKTEHQVPSNFSSTSNESFEEGEEIMEHVLQTPNWKAFYDIIESVPEIQLKKNEDFNNLKDIVLSNLIEDGIELDYYKYVQFISDNDFRIMTILNNFKKWPGLFIIDLIKCELSRSYQSPSNQNIAELKEWLVKIEFCETLQDFLKVSSWSQCHKICKENPDEVISKLLLCNDSQKLLRFIELYKPDKEFLEQINKNYFVQIFAHNNFSEIKLLLDNLSYNHSLDISYKLLKLLNKLDHLQFVVDYLLNNTNDLSIRKIKLSLNMLSLFIPNEQEPLLCLITEPINIIEVLIMNTKLDKLGAVINLLKSELETIECNDDNNCSIEKVDFLIRKYGEKTLDFRVITQPQPRLLQTPEYKLMQSLDSLNLGSDNKNFIMPDEVPRKDEWIQNDEVLECMCCQEITFSMFNRRHHCRRCGRVVCYNCSIRRMLVNTYGDILVRVCVDCYEQTYGEKSTSETTETLSAKSILCDYWLLTDDPDHNEILRAEFSYDHVPSVSLCLSLMKYHSRTTELPKFLLKQCDMMLRLLLPWQEPVQEIDYMLVIKMLKSLAMAAKMSSVECGLQYGTSQAERVLSQAELLGLLAERGCLTLLPVTKQSIDPCIDSSALRILRNKLLEREQWNLALEVSTKTGLENTGVFAAWGKSCLKAGSLLLAREKFQRCLDKAGRYELTSDHMSYNELDDSGGDVTRSRNYSKMSNLSTLSETKPTKNPPLLNEIIHILESKTTVLTEDVLKEVQNQKITDSFLSLNQSFTLSMQPDAAINILNKLKNLKNVAAGNYTQFQEKVKRKLYSYRPTVDGIFYDECIYYLSRYGSHLSLMEFYVKHGEIERALQYIVDNHLSGDLFIEIYMKCLKDGIINVYQEQMSAMDSTLDLWKDYLMQLCRHLEKQNMLNSLYQIQQFMGDYIRAAMTCVRFYQEDVKNFQELLGKVKYLHMAEEHLKQVLEQDQWVEVASVGKDSSTSQENFEEKCLTNPALLMKMNVKDIDKHIHTISKQNEVVKFLSICESKGTNPMEIFKKMLPQDDSSASEKLVRVPTLFGTNLEKLYLAVLCTICGETVEEGFQLTLSLIKEFKIKPIKVYCEIGKQLAKNEQYDAIAKLVTCIKQSGTNDTVITDLCDEMLTQAISTFSKANVTGTKVEDLIKLISDRATKISAYIQAKQLKTAYFLAVKYKRMSDIRRILREAELLNQPNIKALCQRVLQSHSHNPSHSKD